MTSETGDSLPAPDTVVVVGPGVRRITADNPTPFTSRGTNTYLVGSGEVLVIDPGPDDARHVAAVLSALAGETVTAIVLTHGHLDHTGAVAAVRAATGAPVLGGARRAGQVAGEGGAAPGTAYAPDTVIADGATVGRADHALTAVATPGHASDHLCYALAGTPILFSGDHVMGWSTTVVTPPDGDMGAYMASLDRLLGRSETRYLPGHGEAIDNGPERVRGLRAHRRMREAAILERLRAGDRSIDEIVAVLYRDVDRKLHPAAGSTVLAHLQDLVARGLAGAEGGATRGARYRPT